MHKTVPEGVEILALTAAAALGGLFNDPAYQRKRARKNARQRKRARLRMQKESRRRNRTR